MEQLRLIVGLGNPGKDYAGTRHNVGFMVADRLAEKRHVSWTLERKFSARLGKWEQGEQKAILCEPQTFMNLSGEAVGALSRFYRLTPDKVLVIVDDADLPIGQIRMRPAGSSGGHHGLDSIEQQLATREYPRLRVGIGRKAGEGRQITNYVLGHFGVEEKEILEKVLNRAVEQVECWLSAGIQEAMNRFNGAVSAPANKG
jgi:peptidyl-tRNA hydrolase, PTH1 family